MELKSIDSPTILLSAKLVRNAVSAQIGTKSIGTSIVSVRVTSSGPILAQIGNKSLGSPIATVQAAVIQIPPSPVQVQIDNKATGSLTASVSISISVNLNQYTKIAEVRGISFPRTGLVGDTIHDVILRTRDRSGNVGNVVSVGEISTLDILDGTGAQFIFQRNNTGNVPDAPISSGDQRADDDYIPAGWSDNPQGITASMRWEFISSRTGSTGRWSEFGNSRIVCYIL